MYHHLGVIGRGSSCTLMWRSRQRLPGHQHQRIGTSRKQTLLLNILHIGQATRNLLQGFQDEFQLFSCKLHRQRPATVLTKVPG